MIRSAQPGDAPAIAAIYNHYVRGTTITFETEPVSDEEMAQRLAATSTTYPWLVAAEAGQVVGYAYASNWKARAAYAHTAELSIYLHPQARRRGLGSQLYQELLDELRRRETHVVIGGIALPNAASVALCEKFGFRQVAHFRETGRKFGRWLDVGYWQLIF